MLLNAFGLKNEVAGVSAVNQVQPFELVRQIAVGLVDIGEQLGPAAVAEAIGDGGHRQAAVVAELYTEAPTTEHAVPRIPLRQPFSAVAEWQLVDEIALVGVVLGRAFEVGARQRRVVAYRTGTSELVQDHGTERHKMFDKSRLELARPGETLFKEYSRCSMSLKFFKIAGAETRGEHSAVVNPPVPSDQANRRGCSFNGRLCQLAARVSNQQLRWFGA